MTTYVALLEGGKREETVEVRGAGPGLYEVRLRGRVHRVDAWRHDHGSLSLIVDAASHGAMLDERGTKVQVRLHHAIVPLEILDERRLRMRRAAARLAADGRQLVATRLPGKVVRVLVKAGDEVRAGQGLAVVLAMGMENEMRSPKDGTVAEVRAREGEAVAGGAVLCAVE
jgi:biotin carboxyl carrier protein